MSSDADSRIHQVEGREGKRERGGVVMGGGLLGEAEHQRLGDSCWAEETAHGNGGGQMRGC